MFKVMKNVDENDQFKQELKILKEELGKTIKSHLTVDKAGKSI
jgi:hypothetical protein